MLNIHKIINELEMHKEYVNIKYVDTNKQVIQTQINILSEKVNHPSEDWDFIKEKTLDAFSKKTEDFFCFFTVDAEKVNILELTVKDLERLKDNTCQYYSELYVIPTDYHI